MIKRPVSLHLNEETDTGLRRYPFELNGGVPKGI
jgi:hypothetical protein